MFVNAQGSLTLEEPTQEQAELMDLREKFLRNPLLGYQQMIDVAQLGIKEMQGVLVENFKKALYLDTYEEEVVSKLYDHTRQELYNYYKTNLKSKC